MRDPMRFDEGEATPFERQLLEAGKREVPGPALKAHMLEGLGLLNATSPVHMPGKAAGVAGKSAGLSWTTSVGVALVAVGLVATVPFAWRASHSRNEISTARTLPAVETRTAMPPPVAPTSPAQEGQLGPAITASQASKDQAPADAADGAAAERSLREEIVLLDRVREAMVAGTPRQALTELRRYAARYPRGAFSPEAVVLRIEALDAAGDSQSAKALGRRFLAQHPKSPLSDRVATLVRR